jgi:uncharacterized membrane protein YdfJ with MMPL/SSD domain
VIGVVLTLSFVLLTLAFRSIAIPLTAIAVNLLSVGAAYGLLVLVFQKGLLPNFTTGAAAIIIVVFSGFATGQLVAFQEMGFGIAVASVLDATLVRMLIIPAAMQLLGERNWYLPRALRRLPDLRVEAILTRRGQAKPRTSCP